MERMLKVKVVGRVEQEQQHYCRAYCIPASCLHGNFAALPPTVGKRTSLGASVYSRELLSAVEMSPAGTGRVGLCAEKAGRVADSVWLELAVAQVLAAVAL